MQQAIFNNTAKLQTRTKPAAQPQKALTDRTSRKAYEAGTLLLLASSGAYALWALMTVSHL